MTTFKGTSESDQYYIQDSRTFVGNCVSWWRPGGNGYTTNLLDAGKYAREMATGKRETDHAWPVERINHIAALTVDMQLLIKTT